MFGKRINVIPKIKYDPDIQSPVLKCSICNGEQVAGFKDKQSGKFTEVMLVRDKGDLELFMKTYGLTEVAKEY